MSRTLLIFQLRRGAQYWESPCTQSILIPRTDRLCKTPNCFPHPHLYNNPRLFYLTFSRSMKIGWAFLQLRTPLSLCTLKKKNLNTIFCHYFETSKCNFQHVSNNHIFDMWWKLHFKHFYKKIMADSFVLLHLIS